MIAHSTIRFSVFELDLEAGELRRNGLKIRLQEQPFQILVSLLERPGHVVTRDELRRKLWPVDTFVDFDHGLNAAIRRLREALDDSADTPRFVETVARRGYRFIAPVNHPPSVTVEPTATIQGTSSRQESAPRRSARVLSVVFVATGLLATAGVVLTASVYWHRVWVSYQPTEIRLTANPQEAPIRAGVISPDGKYLAYCDPTGLYLRHVESVETSRIALANGASGCPSSWFPDSIHFLVSVAAGRQERQIWKMSVTGGMPQTLTENGFGATVSADGLQIAFLRDGPLWGRLGRELWLMQSNGERMRRLAEARSSQGAEWGHWFGPAVWSGTGHQIAYTIYKPGPGAANVSLLTHNPQSGQTHVLLADTNLESSLFWTRDGRLLYVLRGAPDQNASSAWSMQVDPNSGEARGRSRRITTGLGVIKALSATADGKELAVLRNDTQDQVFIADYDPSNNHLTPPRRLTLDGRANVATAWTADSKAVLFFSNRTGSSTIYKQAIGQSVAEQLISGPGDRRVPRLSPDGAQFLYVEQSRPEDPTIPGILMRMPVSGGSPQVVLKEPGITNFECARLPSQLCVFSTQLGDVTTFFSFDLVNGKGRELGRIPGEPYGYNWGLSPDGSSIALIKFDEREGHLRFLSVRDGKLRGVEVAGWGRLDSVDWTADGTAILVPSLTSKGTTALLQIDRNARAKVLWEGEKDFYFTWIIPSPDGHRFAFVGRVGENNVWRVENF